MHWGQSFVLLTDTELTGKGTMNVLWRQSIYIKVSGNQSVFKAKVLRTTKVIIDISVSIESGGKGMKHVEHKNADEYHSKEKLFIPSI